MKGIGLLTLISMQSIVWGASLSNVNQISFPPKRAFGMTDDPEIHQKKDTSWNSATDNVHDTGIQALDIPPTVSEEKLEDGILDEINGSTDIVRDLGTLAYLSAVMSNNQQGLVLSKETRHQTSISMTKQPSTFASKLKSSEQSKFVKEQEVKLHFNDTFKAENLNISGESFEEKSIKLGRVMNIFPRNNDTSQCVTPKGEVGHCRRLTECSMSETWENYSLFLPYLCIVRSILVGICCPDNPVIEVVETVDNTSEVPVRDLKQPSEGCGINVNARIVGGIVSTPHEWSWMVALMRRNRFFCGGVIINDLYVLTAAHCVLGVRIKDLKVRLGEYNFLEKSDQQHDLSVAEIKRHALFVTLTFQNDIALLKLKQRIEFSKFIGSICLPNLQSGNFSGANATVVGWGAVSFGGIASPVLRQVSIPVWRNEDCDETYFFERISDAFLCAGVPENGEDACQGDSGGPLMAMEGDRWEVIGIVSWGRRCGDPRYPGVYTRITSYLDWIEKNMN